MLHTSNRERSWAHLYACDAHSFHALFFRRMKMSWKRRRWVFDFAEAAHLSTFASLTKHLRRWEAHWWTFSKHCRTLKCNAPAIRRCQAFFLMSFLTTLQQKLQTSIHTKNSHFSNSGHVSTTDLGGFSFNPKWWCFHPSRLVSQAEPRALMRPEPPEDLKRFVVGGRKEMGVLVFFWFFFVFVFWKFVPKKMRQILMNCTTCEFVLEIRNSFWLRMTKPRDPKCLTFTVSERHDLFRVLLQGAHAEVIIGWLE